MVHKKIATVLGAIGTIACLEKAKLLQDQTHQTSTLNLRNLSLQPNDVKAIAKVLKQEDRNASIKSISFSYNRQIGDSGANVLAKQLPVSLTEIGFVDCGIADKGGSAILNWMTTATDLSIICMEDNHFSDGLKMEFRTFKKNNPGIIVVV